MLLFDKEWEVYKFKIEDRLSSNQEAIDRYIFYLTKLKFSFKQISIEIQCKTLSEIGYALENFKNYISNGQWFIKSKIQNLDIENQFSLFDKLAKKYDILIDIENQNKHLFKLSKRDVFLNKLKHIYEGDIFYFTEINTSMIENFLIESDSDNIEEASIIIKLYEHEVNDFISYLTKVENLCEVEIITPFHLCHKVSEIDGSLLLKIGTQSFLEIKLSPHQNFIDSRLNKILKYIKYSNL